MRVNTSLQSSSTNQMATRAGLTPTTSASCYVGATAWPSGTYIKLHLPSTDGVLTSSILISNDTLAIINADLFKAQRTTQNTVGHALAPTSESCDAIESLTHSF